MSGLQISYSKEIAKELTKIAVVLPGSPVKVGQIIYFPFGGNRGIWPFLKPAPRGSFNIVTTLSHLGVKEEASAPESDGDPYIFSSRRSVKIDFSLSGTGSSAGGGNAAGGMTASFEKEGSVYFAAIDCKTTSLLNLDQIQIDLAKHANSVNWTNTFLVTSVTIASKALIMQSSSGSATLSVTGNIKGLVTKSTRDVSANSQIDVNSFKEASFIKPWSDNVEVFIGLHRFSKNTFGHRPANEVAREMSFESPELRRLAGELMSHVNDEYDLKEVSALELLDERDIAEM